MSAHSARSFATMLPPAVRRWYLITAGLVAVITSAYTAWRDALGAMPENDLFEIYNLIISLLVVTWLASDPEFPADKRPSFDHGLMLWMAFPAFALYQLFTTRRWRGVLTLFALGSLYLVPAIAVVLVELVMAV